MMLNFKLTFNINNKYLVCAICQYDFIILIVHNLMTYIMYLIGNIPHKQTSKVLETDAMKINTIFSQHLE